MSEGDMKEDISIYLTTLLLSLLPPFEPTLFPKLQVYFADFPYLRFAIQTPEASNLEDLLRLSVRNGMKLSLLHIIFHGTMHPHTYGYCAPVKLTHSNWL